MSNYIKKDYIEQLTWLRGLAVFFVIISHVIRITEVKYSLGDEVTHGFMVSLFDLGRFGVVLFFALSGCTLYLSNYDKVRYGKITTFYIKRFFRIWPAYVVSLVCYIIFSNFFITAYGEERGFWIEPQFFSTFSMKELGSYLLLMFNITGPKELFNNAYWSLPVEFQYYLIFPVIIYLLRFMGIIGPVLLSIVIYLLPKTGFINFDSTMVFNLAFTFCGGILVGHLYKYRNITLKGMFGGLLMAIFILLISLIENSYVTLPDLPIISNKWNWYGAIAILCVYITLVTKIHLRSKIESFLKHYGTISYSTYLYHNIFIAISVLFIVNYNIHDVYLRFIGSLVFTSVCSYIVASISYKHIENPSILFGRNLIKKVH